MVLFACSHTQHVSKRLLKKDSNEYWNTLTETIRNEDDSSLDKNLLEYEPELYSQIEKDAKDPYLLMFWGRSSNIDSSNKKIIVDEKILHQLNKKFNYFQSGEFCHAGIIHTYGYLFSDLLTPYGYKRKRWIEQTLNKAFSFSNESLSPQTKQGTLLSNLTYFTGMITLKNKTSLQLLKNVSSEILSFDFESLKISRLEEKVQNLILKSFFVKFPRVIPSDENRFLLIYVVEDLSTGAENLITAFPVNEKTLLNIQKDEFLGKNQSISLRYNALIENYPKNNLGTRTFFNNN